MAHFCVGLKDCFTTWYLCLLRRMEQEGVGFSLMVLIFLFSFIKQTYCKALVSALSVY